MRIISSSVPPPLTIKLPGEPRLPRRGSKKAFRASIARNLHINPADIALLQEQPKAVKVLGVFDQKPAHLRDSDLEMLTRQQSFTNPPTVRRLSAQDPVVPVGPFNVRRRHMQHMTNSEGDDADKRGRMLGIRDDELALFLHSPKAGKVLGVGNDKPPRPLSHADLRLLKRQAALRGEWRSGERRPSGGSSGRRMFEGDQTELFQNQPKAYKVLGMDERRPQTRMPPPEHVPDDLSTEEGNTSEVSGDEVETKQKIYAPPPRMMRKDKRAAVLGVPFREIDRFRGMPKAYKLSGLWSQNGEPTLRPEDADLVKKQVHFQRRPDELGTLRVMLKYDVHREILRVVILEANNLALTEKRLDARVQVGLVEAGPALRPASKVLKTSIQKNTTNPIFDEAFLFPIGCHMLDSLHLLLTLRDNYLAGEWLGCVLIPLDFLLAYPRPDCRWHHIRDGFVLEDPPRHPPTM